MQRLSCVALVVRDYDEAIAWFRDALGFVLLEDTPRGPGKRWVRMAASADAQTSLLLARAVGDEQLAAIGHFAGGRVGLFLEVDDFDATHARMLAKGVRFCEAPRRESYGSVAVFEDLYGNRWDLLGQPAP
jgi:catechol 2,3-dioxygenase-like lactoylglutathione lyase family enzyme